MSSAAGGRGLSLFVAPFLALTSITAAQAETRALIVGVSQFQSPLIPDLRGPVNDLSAMEALARNQGATDVTVLRDENVTRTAVETALHALGLRSKPGDWIMFYYSGHGAQAEAAVKGTADGDLDQFVPLPQFDPENQDPEQFIADKDFYAWLARYVPSSVQILMIADTCHSGTLHRSVDRTVYNFTPRVALPTLVEDGFHLVPRPAPKFPSVLTANNGDARDGRDRADLPNLIFMAAAQDGQLALEASMPSGSGIRRGFLTYAFERGLTARGPDGKTMLADLDRDGAVTAGEMAIYVDSQVRALTSQQQEPKTSFVAGRENVQLFGKIPPMKAQVPGQRLPNVFSAEAGAGAVLRMENAPWAIARASSQADFVWQYSEGKLLRRSGDVVATEIANAAALRGVIEKWNALEELRPFLDEARAKLTVGPAANGARYVEGATVNVALKFDGRDDLSKPAFATIFNLASDGTVQLLYPAEEADGNGVLNGSGTLPLLENRVVPPFGADHIVAVMSREDQGELRARLRTMNNQRAAGRVVAPIRKLLDGKGSGLSVAEIYTGE